MGVQYARDCESEYWAGEGDCGGFGGGSRDDDPRGERRREVELLERGARGGTRYTEIVRAHFGVLSPDARLQRPEYLGGGSTPVSINPIAQTSATGVTGGATPMANLAANVS